VFDPDPSAASVTKPIKSPCSILFYYKYKEDDQQKRNCTKYLAYKAKGESMTSDSATLVVNVVDIFLVDTPNSTWVHDSGSVIHICNLMQELIRSRSMVRDEVDIRVGNKERATTLAVGTIQIHYLQLYLCNLFALCVVHVSSSLNCIN
jgi:hypothetical protein